FGGCHPGKHGAPVGSPHLTRQSEGKVQLAVEDFPAEKSSSVSLFFCDPDMHPSDFSLLVPRHEEEQVERPDEDKMLMQKAAGL
ncbi:hypothetical protein ACSLOI_28055, partial [Escherichia coli]